MGSSGGVVNESPLAASLLTIGQETFPREVASGSVTQTSGTLRLAFFTARKTETEASVSVATGSTPAGATPTLVRFGLYSVAGNGNITLIASTPNDTSLLAGATTLYTKAFSVAVTVTKGTRYAFATLVITAATAPTIAGGSLAGSPAMWALAPRLSAQVAGQTDLPSSVVAGALVDTASRPFGILTP